MPLLPPHYLDAVIAIGTGTSGNRQWIGTGFFYGVPVAQPDGSPPKSYTIFLVTNRHVVAGVKKICMRLNSQADSAYKEYDIDIVSSNGRPVWVGHPDPNVDIVALWLNAGFLERDRRRFSYFAEGQSIISSAILKSSSISEGDGVFLLGYPMGLVGDHHHVICRSGSIARIRDVKSGSGTQILIDGLVFPGNSGGPVVTRPTIHSITGTKAFESSYLLGIVTSYVPYRDIAVSQQTNNPRIIFEENSGLSVAHPTELVTETVAAAHTRHKERIKRNARKVTPPKS